MSLLPLFGALLLIVSAHSAIAAKAGLAAPCSELYVSLEQKTITVLPTGTDDTANLQCAIELAATLGPGVTVQLGEGTFTTGQLVVKDLRGTIRGTGQTATVLHNPATPMPIDRPDCTIGGSQCFIDSPPSPTNRYPSLISILGKDVALSDLTIEIVGPQSTALWHSPWGFDIELLSNVVEFLGSDSTLSVERVLFISGGVAYDPVNNAFAGQSVGALNMWSFSRPWFVTNSSLSVADCTFHGLGGLFTYNIDLSRVFVANNRFEISDTGTAWFISDARRSHIAGNHNEVKALGAGVSGIFGWAGNIGTGIASSFLLFDNNIFTGETGIAFQPGIFDDVKCQAVNNNVSNVANPYVYDATTPCKVVGNGGPK